MMSAMIGITSLYRTLTEQFRFYYVNAKLRFGNNGESFKRRASIAAERYNPEEDNEPYPSYPKTDEQRKRVKDAVKDNFLFSALDIEELQILIDAMFEKAVKPNECIIKEGDPGDNFYIIDSGTFDILKKENNKDKKVGQYVNKGSFGELALMYNQPRAATITAKTAGKVWALDRKSFRRILLKTAHQKRQLYEKFLSGVSILSQLTHYERLNICDALQTKRYPPNEVIISQGSKADGMYFVESGSVKVKRKQDNKEEILATLKSGDYFGELALLTNNPRAATVFAVDNVKCAFLEVSAFERLLGPCKDIMQRNASGYQKQLKELFGDNAKL